MGRRDRRRHRPAPRSSWAPALPPGGVRPTADRLRAVEQERAARPAVPMLGQTAFDLWSEWFAQQDHPFARAWADFFPGPAERAAGTGPDPDARKRLEGLAASAYEVYLRAQNDAFAAAVQEIQEVDPLALLVLLLFKTQFAPWGSSQDPAHFPDDLDLEITAQIIAANAPAPDATFDPERVLPLLGLIEHVRLLAHAVNVIAGFLPNEDGADDPETGDPDLNDDVIRNQLMTMWLTSRGSAYPPHARRLAHELGRTYDVALVDRIGFNVDDVITLAETLLTIWGERVPGAVDTAADVIDEAIRSADHEESKDFAEKIGTIVATPVYLVPAMAPTVSELRERLPAPTTGRLDAILARLAARPGGGAKAPSVLVDPLIRERPFVLFDPEPTETRIIPRETRVVAAGAMALTTDMPTMVEALLRAEFPQSWSKVRAAAVDQYAVDMLKSRLPGCRAHTSVFVDAPDGSGRFEIDGVVLFDDAVFFIEGKGAPFKLAGRRGSVDNYRRQLRDLIGEGCKQLARDAGLLQHGVVPLLNESGEQVDVLDPARIRRSFQVLPCLDGLGGAGTNLRLLDTWGIVPANQTPWIVAVAEMQVVIDALRGPGELVAFLEWRSRWARDRRLIIIDEIEMFSLFQRAVDVPLKLRGVLADQNRVIFASGQPAFDDYYAGVEGRGPQSPQPRLRLSSRFRRFADELQRIRPDGWLGAAAAALQASEAVQLSVDDRNLQRQLARDANEYGVIVTGDSDYGTVVIGEHRTWSDAYAEDDLAQRYGDRAIVMFFRAQGTRLRLEWACHGDDATVPPRWLP